MPPRESSLEPLPSFLSLDSSRPAPALQNRAQRGAEAAYSASVSFEGGGVKIPRKRTTRVLRAFPAMLWNVVFMARIIPNLPIHRKWAIDWSLPIFWHARADARPCRLR